MAGRVFSGEVTRMSSTFCLTLTARSEEHTSELQSQSNLVCRLLLEKKKKINILTFIFQQSGRMPSSSLRSHGWLLSITYCIQPATLLIRNIGYHHHSEIYRLVTSLS